MKKVVTKLGVYLCDKYCGEVWQTSELKWSGAFCKSRPKKNLADGDFVPRVSGSSQQEAAAMLAKIAQKEFETTDNVIKFGPVQERGKKPLPFTFA